jgi:hypothetical protein
LQNANSAVRLIGQQADQALKALADARQVAGDCRYVILFISVCFLHSNICRMVKRLD